MIEQTPTPSFYIERDIKIQKQLDSFYAFQQKTIRQASLIAADRSKYDSPVRAEKQITNAGRMEQMSKLTEVVEEAITNEKIGVIFAMEDILQLAPKKGIPMTTFPLRQSTREEQFQIGKSKGIQDFINCLRPIEIFSFGKVLVPLHPLRINEARIAYPTAIADGDELLTYQDTTVLGIQMESYYAEGENYPRRSFINSPDSIKL